MPSLASLDRRLITCARCPRLVAWREQVAREKVKRHQHETYWGRPVPGFGPVEARLLLVGLAPGAHGSNRTGRMFTGDASGDWLFEALHHFGFANQAVSTSREDGLELIDSRIVAAARCAPPGNKPTPAELANCRPWLEAELKLLRHVAVVIGLGRIGFEAWLEASGHRGAARRSGAAAPAAAVRPGFAHGAEWRAPDGSLLIASYHPSRQNTNTGKLTRAMWHAVFRRARAELDRIAPRRGALHEAP